MSSDFNKIRKGITFEPQTSDPIDGQNGDGYYNSVMLKFRKYQNGAWEDWDTAGGGGSGFQSFTHKVRFAVRAASTVNVDIATQLENGDSFGGVTLVTGNLILLKNQTTTSENGVYVVQATGAALRSTSYDDAAELTNAHIYVTAGTNINTIWFQNNVLTTLADAQSWANTPAAFLFTVPAGVNSISVIGNGGGGGGGGGGGANSANNNSANGGSGGLGSALQEIMDLPVVPGSILTINLGVGGRRGAGGGTGPSPGQAGGDGTNTTVSGFIAGVTQIVLPGARGGPGGLAGVGATPTPTNTTYTITNMRDGAPVFLGGAGGGTFGGTSATGGSPPAQTSVRGAAIPVSVGGVGGTQAGGGLGGGGGGGGGSSNFGAGGNGGRGANNIASNNAPGVEPASTNFGAGGGGGGGGSEATNVPGQSGAWGIDGYIGIAW